MIAHSPTRTPRFAFAAAALVALACGGGNDAETGGDPMTDAVMETTAGEEVATVYAPELGIDLNAMSRIEGGVHIRDLEIGRGDTASAGDRVSVEYAGWFPNGVQFDSSDGDPIEFTLGVGDVIQGWDQGIMGMQVGGRRLLVIPPIRGYGEAGRPGVIPSSATLVFDVRLVEIMPDSAVGPGGEGPGD